MNVIDIIDYHHDIVSEFWTTGMVPYSEEIPKATLAELNQASVYSNVSVCYLKNKLWDIKFRKVEGLNAFSESYNACRMAKKYGITELFVVSSDFYWVAYERLWKKTARRFNVDLHICKVEHASGIVSEQVIKFYKSFKIRALVRLALMGRFGNWSARKVADFKTRGRKKGFPIDGHTTIG